jgi:hypothetical protein
MTTSSKLSDEQVRTLLNSTETNRVDYKRKMGFKNGTDQQKANLLKDVLAMSNATHGDDGYLVFGVEHSLTGNEIIGVEESDSVDNSRLTNYINSKTNKDIEFYYYEYVIQDKKIGILTIKPDGYVRYVTETICGTRDNAVYYRNNDTNAIMSPSEIADRAIMKIRPELDVYLLCEDNDGKFSQSTKIVVQDLLLNDDSVAGIARRLSSRLSKDQVAQLQERYKELFGDPWSRLSDEQKKIFTQMTSPNVPENKEELMRDHFEYRKKLAKLKKVCIAAHNNGRHLASNCSILIDVPKIDSNIRALADLDLPSEPKKYTGFSSSQSFVVSNWSRAGKNKSEITDCGDHYLIRLHLGTIQCGDYQITNYFYIGSEISDTIVCPYEVYYDESGGPTKDEFELIFIVEQETITYSKIRDYVFQ